MADRTSQFYNSEGIHGYGAQWLIGDGTSPQNYQAVAYVKTITPGDMTTEVIDITHLRSPEAHREKMAGLRDSGAFAMQCMWAPNDESQSNAGGGVTAFQAGGLVALWRSREARDMVIVLNDGSPATNWPFRGIITKFQPGEIGEDGAIMLDVEVTPVADFSALLP
jgi:hypothetical protein